jgi:hypothetical protein
VQTADCSDQMVLPTARETVSGQPPH